jgi:rRNA biogenesis protein RRP36
VTSQTDANAHDVHFCAARLESAADAAVASGRRKGLTLPGSCRGAETGRSEKPAIPPADRGDEGLSTSGSESDADSEHTSSSDSSNASAGLLHVPLGERAARLADGSVGMHGPHAHAAHTAARGKRLQRDGADAEAADTTKRKRRKDKHAPVEEGIARRPVAVVRDALQRRGAHHLDPRFLPVGNKEGKAGVRDGGDPAARRRYKFLFAEKLPAELWALKGQLKEAREPAQQRRLQQRISKVVQSIKHHEDRELEDEVCCRFEHISLPSQVLRPALMYVCH